jgi:hypothetical protein
MIWLIIKLIYPAKYHLRNTIWPDMEIYKQPNPIRIEAAGKRLSLLSKISFDIRKAGISGCRKTFE